MTASVAEAVAALSEAVDAANERRKWQALAPSVSDMERRAQRLFRSQAIDVKAALATFAGRWPVAEATIPDRMSEFVERVLRKRRTKDAERLRPPLAAAMTAALETLAIASWGVSFELEDVGATGYMREHGAELVRELNKSTVADLRAILTRGISEGWSYDRVAKEIVAKYAAYSAPRPQRGMRTRAHLIAVTENAFAYEHAHMAMAQMLADAGLRMLKEWGVSSDERTCEVCMGNGGEGATNLADAFSSGDQQPPAHPACRCWMETYLDPAFTAPDAVTVNGMSFELTL